MRVLLHSARGPDDVIVGDELRALEREHEGFRLHEQDTAREGRLAPEHLDDLCSDWRERATFASGSARLVLAHAERVVRTTKTSLEMRRLNVGYSGMYGKMATAFGSFQARWSGCELRLRQISSAEQYRREGDE